MGKNNIQDLRSNVGLIMASDESPQRKGGLIAAAVRRYRRTMIIEFLDQIIVKESLDITPTLANRLIFELTGRSISRKYLLECYATKNRTASAKSEDFNRLDELANKYRDDYALLDQQTTDLIASIKSKQR